MPSVAESNKILIASDAPGDLNALKRLLQTPEREILTAASGEETRQCLLKQPDISLILLDIPMPGLDDFESARLILERKEFQNIPILFIIERRLINTYVEQGLQFGVVDYLVKPIDNAILKNKVTIFLTLQNQKKQLAWKAAERAQAEKKLQEQRQTLEALVKERTAELTRANEQLKQKVAESKQAEELIQMRNRGLTLLNQIIAASAAGIEPTTILETVCRELAWAFNVPHVKAALLNKEKTATEIVAEYQTGGEAETLNDTIYVADSPSLQYLLKHKAPLAVSDIQNDPRLAPTNIHMRQRGSASLLILPLIIDEDMVGGLSLNTVTPHTFSTEEIELAWSVAEQVAGALSRTMLIRERRRLSTAIEQSAEGVVITDTEGIAQYVNPAFEKITGYSRTEALGQNMRFINSGEQNDAFYHDLWSTITAGKVWQERIVNKKKDGNLYTEDIIITPVYDDYGSIANYVAIKRDITRELALEEQYRQSQKMEAVGQLAGGIAHDFNNILTAIIGYASLPLYLNLLPPEHKVNNNLKNIQQSAERAANLTRQLLTFARRQIVEPRVFNLNHLILNLNKMLRSLIGENIELVIIPAADLGQIKADPVQIEQVLVNLAVNARDAMPHGGKLTIETANIALDENHPELSPGNYVRLTVSDTGVGMTKEVTTRIFDPFFTTKEKGKGTGLGLSTCYGIIKQSGGHIEVYSKPNQRTTFKVYLPRIEESVASGPEPRQSARLPQGTETILLVEDEAAVRATTMQTLQQQGYTVLEATNGEEALRVFKAQSEQNIHLLLSDVVMPILGGLELAKCARAIRPELKVLFMSGYADNAALHNTMRNTGASFLQKPFSPDALARKVREVLDD